MSLSLDQSEQSNYLRFFARYIGTSATATATNGPIRLTLGREAKLVQINTILHYLVKSVDREMELLGTTAFEKASISQWMSFAVAILPHDCPQAGTKFVEMLETTLTTKTYIIGNRVTLADLSMFWIVSKLVNDAIFTKSIHVKRWFNQMQHEGGIMGSKFHPTKSISVNDLYFPA